MADEFAAALREARKETEEGLICEDCGYAGSFVKLNRDDLSAEGRDGRGSEVRRQLS